MYVCMYYVCMYVCSVMPIVEYCQAVSQAMVNGDCEPPIRNLICVAARMILLQGRRIRQSLVKFFFRKFLL